MRKVLPIVAFLSLAATASASASQSGQMHVSVEVVARTIITIDNQPAAVTVTSDDVARGYVDVPSAVAFRVRSNARNGYSLQFQAISGPFTKAEIAWGNVSATVGSDSSWVTQPYAPTTSGLMSVRLTLAPATPPGSYAWPVSIGADSL